MKRVIVALATVALAAGALVALSGVASAREAEPFAADQAKLPPLPADIKERKRWNIAVKCDSPPFGYIGARSQQAGFDVEIARWIEAEVALGMSPDRDGRLIECLRFSGARSAEDAQLDRHQGLGVAALVVSVPTP